MKKITSTANDFIKHILQLDKLSARKAANSIVIEGIREIYHAIEANYKIKTLLFCFDVVKNEDKDLILKSLKQDCEQIEINKQVYEKLSYREASGGIIAIAEPQYLGFKDLKLRKNPLILIVEKVEKPGNLGAILRTADACSVDAVFVCDNQTDIFNPNVIRSSVGCLFTNQVVVCSNEEALKFLKTNQIQVFATDLHISENYHLNSYKESCAIVMGSEAFGISSFWRENADSRIKIPMLGKIDSINVSTATAVILFEVLRQREFYSNLQQIEN